MVLYILHSIAAGLSNSTSVGSGVELRHLLAVHEIGLDISQQVSGLGKSGIRSDVVQDRAQASASTAIFGRASGVSQGLQTLFTRKQTRKNVRLALKVGARKGTPTSDSGVSDGDNLLT